MTVHKKTRHHEGGRHQNSEASQYEISIPVFSIGKCNYQSYRKECTNYGELGDGICITCWDKVQASGRARAHEKRSRRASKYVSTKVMV